MKKLLSILILVCSLAQPIWADDAPLTLDAKIAKVVKLQGTVVGENITSAAIIDDLIAREGDTFLIDEASGRLIAKLAPKELSIYPVERQVRVVSIITGSVIISHLDTTITLVARP